MGTFQVRRDTAANFTTANPTLALGEPAVETDTGRIKIGDGATNWAALGYMLGVRPAGAGAGNMTWVANKTYYVNDIVISPTSRLAVRCKTSHTAGSSYSSANWEPLGYAAYDVLSPPRGIEDFIAGMWARAFPPLAEPRPAVTMIASGFSLETELGAGFQEFAWNAGSPPFRKIGINGQSIAVASTTVEGNYVTGSEGVGGRNPFAIEFDTDAALIFLSYRGNSTSPAYPSVGVTVDGRPVSANYFHDTSGNTSVINGLKIALPGPGRYRRIKLHLANIDWRSIAVPAGATVAAPSYTPARKKVAVLGNSWIQGYVNHTTDPHHITPLLGRVLDVDIINCGIGGTGYVQAGTASVFGSTARLAALQLAAPDLVIVFGAQNDDGLSGVQAAATALYSEIATRLPAAKILVVGPESTNYNSVAGREANVTALQAAAAAAPNVLGGYVINPYGEKWITGSGRIGTQNGDGIADKAMVSDAIHPTFFGTHQYVRRIVEHMAWLALRLGKANGFGFSVADLIA